MGVSGTLPLFFLNKDAASFQAGGLKAYFTVFKFNPWGIVRHKHIVPTIFHVEISCIHTFTVAGCDPALKFENVQF